MRIEVGGKEFQLQELTLNDWVLGEDMGLEIERLQTGRVKLRDLRTLCFIALHRVDEKITEDWVGKNISFTDGSITDSIVNFIMPKEVKKGKKAKTT